MQNFLPSNIRHRFGTALPHIPKPEHKEDPDVEELVTEHHDAHHDPRPQVIKPYRNIAVPQFNRMYGTLRVEDGWQYVIDNYANGNITTIAGALAVATVTLAQPLPELRLSRWPGAISMYLCIRTFSLAFSGGALATNGSVDMYYQDTIGGQTIPLGTSRGQIGQNTGAAGGLQIVIPTPITDPGITNVGQLQANLSAGATTGTFAWQIGFSYAYLLATQKPYEIQQIEEMFDGHPGHVQRFDK